ncbi:MAG: alpha-glycosidase [Clostridia bacterium]|nr:alpha-glycosidase [Clostridia bacterium]
MNRHAILHIPDSSYAHALTENRVVLRLRAAKGDLKRCVLLYGDRVEPFPRVKMHPLDMKLVASDNLFDYFEADFETDINRICYIFWLDDGTESIYYYSGLFTQKPSFNRVEYFQFPYVRREDIAAVPDWAKNVVMYQIFPDSFATSKGFISGKPVAMKTRDGHESTSLLGGTIKGVTENADYLEKLGVNCIYINPVFVAGAYHKYDTIDYLNVDPCFGTNEDFKEMVDTLHQHGIRVILDGVFNHCGWKFFAFQDVLEKGEKSVYKDWFYQLEYPVTTEPINYAAFAYVKEMPKLNTGNPEVVKYFCDVGRYWIREMGTDGWRLDVANEIDHDFWRAFRKAVREEKPDAFLIGEIWEDAEQWLLGDQFDSAMNYRFTDLVIEFIGQNAISVDDFDARLNAMLMRYKKQVTLVQMNMLDSHDVPRFLSKCDRDLRRLRLAALFELTYVGIPSIFAGDEKGIWGMTEPEYRRPMIWDDTEESAELTRYYQKLIAIRKGHMELFTGDCSTVLKDSGRGLYAFKRSDNKGQIVVVMNNSDFAHEVVLPAFGKKTLTNLMTQESFEASKDTIRIVLPPVSGAILY